MMSGYPFNELFRHMIPSNPPKNRIHSFDERQGAAKRKEADNNKQKRTGHYRTQKEKRNANTKYKKQTKI